MRTKGIQIGVNFLDEGIASVVVNGGESAVEAGIIGREGGVPP